MTWQDAAVVAGTAAVTALAVLAVCWTGQAVAKEGEKPEIQWPVLKASGCEITLRAEACQPGQQPVVQLVAANPTGDLTSLEATVRMMVQQPPQPLARRLALPKKAWEHTLQLSLHPGERKTLAIPTNVTVPTGQMAFFQLSAGDVTVNTRLVALLKTPALEVTRLPQRAPAQTREAAQGAQP